MEVSKETYLKFFKTALQIWTNCEEKIGDTNLIEGIGTDKKLKKLQESVVEDASRVGEAIIMSVAGEIAENDSSFSRLLSKLDTAISIENIAEDIEDNALLAYAASGGSNNQTASIMNIAMTGENEENTEKNRIELMKAVYKKVEPILKEHGLVDAINEWIGDEWKKEETE